MTMFKEENRLIPRFFLIMKFLCIQVQDKMRTKDPSTAFSTVSNRLEIRLSTGHRWSEADDRAQLSLMLYFKSHANHHFTYHLYFSVTTSPVASGEAAIEDSREAVVTILHTAFIKVGNK